MTLLVTVVCLILGLLVMARVARHVERAGRRLGTRLRPLSDGSHLVLFDLSETPASIERQLFEDDPRLAPPGWIAPHERERVAAEEQHRLLADCEPSTTLVPELSNDRMLLRIEHGAIRSLNPEPMTMDRVRDEIDGFFDYCHTYYAHEDRGNIVVLVNARADSLRLAPSVFIPEIGRVVRGPVLLTGFEEDFRALRRHEAARFALETIPGTNVPRLKIHSADYA